MKKVKSKILLETPEKVDEEDSDIEREGEESEEEKDSDINLLGMSIFY